MSKVQIAGIYLHEGFHTKKLPKALKREKESPVNSSFRRNLFPVDFVIHSLLGSAPLLHVLAFFFDKITVIGREKRAEKSKRLGTKKIPYNRSIFPTIFL